MKISNYLLLAAAAAFTVNAASATPLSTAESHGNKALLASPRYLEEHPELLRVQTFDEESPALETSHLTKLTENTALAKSPRFLEEHPELRWTTSATKVMLARNIGENGRLQKLTQNKALAVSPRFLEEHPELLHGEPVLEIAPLK